MIASPRTAGFTQNKHAWNKQWRPPRLRGSQTNFWETASTIEHVFVMEQRRPALVVRSHCTKGMFPERGGMAWINKWGFKFALNCSLSQSARTEEHPEHNTMIFVRIHPWCRLAQGPCLHEHVLDRPNERCDQSSERSDLERLDVWVARQVGGASIRQTRTSNVSFLQESSSQMFGTRPRIPCILALWTTNTLTKTLEMSIKHMFSVIFRHRIFSKCSPEPKKMR